MFPASSTLPGTTAGFFQLVSALEVVHAAVGLVGGSPVTALMQWAGRSNVLFGVVAAVPEVQDRPAVGAMFLAWAMSEVIRYPWYAASVAGACPHWLTWLRYVAGAWGASVLSWGERKCMGDGQAIGGGLHSVAGCWHRSGALASIGAPGMGVAGMGGMRAWQPEVGTCSTTHSSPHPTAHPIGISSSPPPAAHHLPLTTRQVHSRTPYPPAAPPTITPPHQLHPAEPPAHTLPCSLASVSPHLHPL